MAAPIEDSTRINHHAWRVNFPSDYALWLDLHSSAGKDHAIKMPGDHHAVAFNLSFDFRVLPEDHRLLGNDVSLYVSVDAKGTCQRQRSLERNALIDETSPFLV